MTIVLARLLARLVGTVLMAAIAVLGAAAAVFCIGDGHSTLSLAGLAHDLRLPQLRGDVEFFLHRTTADGPVAVIAAASGAVAVLIGVILIVGCWRSPRPWRIVLARDDDGSVGTRRRPLARLAAEVAGHDPQVARARARARARRRGDGGRLRVRVRAAVDAERRPAADAAEGAVSTLISGTPLRLRLTARRAGRRERRAALETS